MKERINKHWSKEEYQDKYRQLRLQLKEHGITPGVQQLQKKFNKEKIHNLMTRMQETLVEHDITPIVVTEKFAHKRMRPEEEEPERFGELLADHLKNPEVHIKDLAKQSHMSIPMLSAFLRRTKEKHQFLIQEARKLNIDQLVDALDEKIAMALEYIDPYSLGNASFRDLSVGIGILIDKRRLEKGEPTMILSFEERHSLNDLMPGLILEASRRGIIIDQTPDEPIRALTDEEVEVTLN